MCLHDLLELNDHDRAAQIHLEGLLRRKQAAAEARAIVAGIKRTASTVMSLPFLPAAADGRVTPPCTETAVAGPYREKAA